MNQHPLYPKVRRSLRDRVVLWINHLLVATLLLTPQAALAEVTSNVADGVLTITSDAADEIVITCVDGAVALNSAPIEGAIDCAAVTALQVEGGPGPNRIDASGVLTDDFTTLITITLHGGGGNDLITGTNTIDLLTGGPGNDTLSAGKGADQIAGSAGADELIWRNGDGSDLMDGDEGHDTVHVIGAADKGDDFVVAPNGERVAFTRTNLIPFTLDIGTTETVLVYRGDLTDTVQISRLPATQVIVDGVEPPAAPSTGQTPPMVLVGAGAITNTVEAYRLLLGGANNGGEPGSQPDGRREINWDGVPVEQTAPNFYEPDFFNGPTAPRARGAVFSTPGEGIMISADNDNPNGTLPRFGNINPTYADSFKTFSADRLFSPIGSNIVDLTFYIPGTDTPAVSRGFGAVYTDIDTTHTAFEYFDIDGNSLGRYGAPIADNGLSFLGVLFPEAIVHRVRISYGTSALGPDDGGEVDVAVMDDFIYSEPQPVPAPQVTGASGPQATFQTVAAGRLAAIAVDLSALTGEDRDDTYDVWLVDDEGGYTLIGTAVVDAPFTYTHPNGANLVGITAGVTLSRAEKLAENATAPEEVHYHGEIPAAIRPHIRALVVAALDTPENMPYDPGLQEQAALAWEHGQLAQNAALAGDLTGARMHAEHVWNILHGEASDLYGDINEDGQVQNPGDGYGVWPYAFQVTDLAKQIAATPDLDAARVDAATGMVQCATNISDNWGPAADEKILAILAAANADAAKNATTALVTALEQIHHGVDADGNGAVDAVVDECGAEQAYQLSHQLFDLHLTPATN